MKRILGSVTLAAALAAAPAHATNGMRLTGFGPVQQSMGGAAVGAPLDAVTAVTNPAGLALVAPRVDVAGAAFMPKVKYDVGNGALSDSSSRPTDLLPTLGAIYRANDELTAGVGLLGTAGMGVRYDQGLGGETMSSYSNARLAPAVAYRLNDQLALGLALNLMYAQMKFSANMGGPQVAPPAASSFGYGATVGVTYRPVEMVTVGVAYESQSFFQDFSLDVGGGQTMKLGLDQPMVATVGVGVRPAQGLLVALDGSWINWSAVLGKDKPRTEPNAGFNLNWRDQFVVKLGAEYQLPSLEALKVRAGFNYGQTPVDKERAFESILFPAVSELHVTLGAGYDVGRLGVVASFMYSPEAKVSGTANFGFGPTPWETKMSQTEVQLGVGYKL